MEEWTTLCRCCLASGAQTSILLDHDVLDKFYEATTIQVKEDDGLPQSLCDDCLALMNSALQFKNQCLRIDSELKGQLLEISSLAQHDMTMEIEQTMYKDHEGETSLTQQEYIIEGNAKNTLRKQKQPQNEEISNVQSCDDNNIDESTQVQEFQEMRQEIQNVPEDPAISKNAVIKSEPVESDDDCYYVLVIDEPKKTSKDKKESKNLQKFFKNNSSKEESGELEFEKNVDSFLVRTKQEKIRDEIENITITPDQDNINKQEFSEDQNSNGSENSHFEYSDNISLSNVGTLLNGDSNILKILTAKSSNENLLYKTEDGDEIVTYIVDGQNGDTRRLSQEEVIICEEDDPQLQILDGSQLVIQYEDEGQVSTVTEDGKIVCCGIEFQNLEEYSQHRESHDDGHYMCTFCGKAFESQEIAAGHMLLHINSGPNIQCPYCRQNLKRNSITRHMKYFHNPKTQVDCPVCDKTFTNPANLKRHMSIHGERKSLQCDVCLQSYSCKVALDNHRLTHESHLNCVQCELTFANIEDLVEHQQKHECDRAMRSLEIKDLKRHVLCFACNYCSKMFSVESALKYHVETAHRSDKNIKLLCSECGEVLPNRKALQQHTATHSSCKRTNKRFECKTCGKATNSHAMLVMHERVHTNERPFQCPICMLKFKTKTHLRTHQLTHTREKRFGCSVCMKFFALKGNLVVHLRTHTGERPYTCLLCNEAFIDSKYLKKHKQKKHGITNAPWNKY